MNEVLSRASIAEQADEAAARWVAAPWMQKPANPFDVNEAPEAHKQWRCSFERSLLKHSAPEDCEGGA